MCLAAKEDSLSAFVFLAAAMYLLVVPETAPAAVVRKVISPFVQQPPAAYYVSPSGNDGNPGTRDLPWATFSHAFKDVMAAGDTLILLDGTYREPMGRFFPGQPYNSYSPPSGFSYAYTVIKAEHDGLAVLEDAGIFLGGPVDGTARGSSYVQIEGLTLRRGGVRIRHSDHIKLMRTGVKNGVPIDSRYGEVISISEGSHHVLLEDVWVVGTMVYGIIVFESENVILRRCVVRFDGNTEREPKSGIAFYGAVGTIAAARASLAQNCVVVDYNANPGLGAGMQNVHAAEDIKYRGCLALHIPAVGFLINEDYPARGNDVVNSVVWDVEDVGIAMRDGHPQGATLIDQVTVGTTSRGIDQWSGSAGTNVFTTIQNSLFFHNSGANQGGDFVRYNTYVPGWQAQGTNASVTDPGFRYIVRSPDAGTGEGGRIRGATLLKRYGESGTLWGETGYDALTGENLWPWPYEDRIHVLFSEPDGFEYPTADWQGNPYTVVNNPARGFAAPGQTLTRYVWETLGYPIPGEITGSGSRKVFRYPGRSLTRTRGSLERGVFNTQGFRKFSRPRRFKLK